MLSPARLAANRENGRRSHGPASVEGRARSSQNAIKHGFSRAASVVLPSENMDEYLVMRDAAFVDCAPVGLIEEWLVEHIVEIMWQTNRLAWLQTKSLARASWILSPEELALELHRDPETRAPDFKPDRVGAHVSAVIERLSELAAVIERYEPRLRRDFSGTLAQLLHLQSMRRQRAELRSDDPNSAKRTQRTVIEAEFIDDDTSTVTPPRN